MASTFKTGFFVGTGGAVNVIVGFVPNFVSLTNITDGTTTHSAFPSVKTIAFTSGGTNTIKAGHKLIGVTSGATAIVESVVLGSGSWAGGDAAGWFIVVADSVTGTFTSENCYYKDSSTLNDVSVAATGEAGIVTITTAGPVSNTGNTAYDGTAAGNGEGFTVSSGNSTSTKLFAWAAWRVEQ